MGLPCVPKYVEWVKVTYLEPEIFRSFVWLHVRSNINADNLYQYKVSEAVDIR